MSYLKNVIVSLGEIYISGIYFFSITHIPHVVNNYNDMKKGSIPKLIKQALIWPLSMSEIVKYGNPALDLMPTYKKN